MQVKDPETIISSISSKNAPLDMLKWQELIKGWDATAETQVNYCKRLNLNINTFSHARSKLLQKEKAKLKTKFIPISLKQIDSPVYPPTLVLENKKGMKLTMPVTLAV